MTEHLFNKKPVLLLYAPHRRTEPGNKEENQGSNSCQLAQAFFSERISRNFISKGLAYNYFESKQNIIEALFKQAFDEAEFLFEGLFSLKDPYEKLKFMINASFDMTVNNEEYWRLYTGLALQPGVVETAQRITNEFTSGFLKMLEGVFRKLGVKNPHEEARMFAALFDGLGIQYLLDKKHFPLEKVKKHFLEKYSKEGIEKLKS